MISSVLFQLLGLAAFLMGLFLVFGAQSLMVGGLVVVLIGTGLELLDSKNRKEVER